MYKLSAKHWLHVRYSPQPMLKNPKTLLANQKQHNQLLKLLPYLGILKCLIGIKHTWSVQIQHWPVAHDGSLSVLCKCTRQRRLSRWVAVTNELWFGFAGTFFALSYSLWWQLVTDPRLKGVSVYTCNLSRSCVTHKIIAGTVHLLHNLLCYTTFVWHVGYLCSCTPVTLSASEVGRRE